MLGGCAHGVKARAAAEHFVEGLAEVAKAGVADFKGGLGDVAFSGAQEFGSALKTGAAEPLGEGEAGLTGEGAAEIEVAAGNATAKFFEGGGLGEVFQHYGLGPSDTLGGEPLGTGAEGLSFGGGKEELGGEFEGFALVPEALGRSEDGRVQERLEEVAVAVSERGDAREAGNG